mgnify:CR=1 FL=1
MQRSMRRVLRMKYRALLIHSAQAQQCGRSAGGGAACRRRRRQGGGAAAAPDDADVPGCGAARLSFLPLRHLRHAVCTRHRVGCVRAVGGWVGELQAGSCLCRRMQQAVQKFVPLESCLLPCAQPCAAWRACPRSGRAGLLGPLPLRRATAQLAQPGASCRASRARRA